MSKKTPLYNWHVQHGGKMVEFGGFLMPVSYEGVLAEHHAVRERCGLFDISHMGEIYVEGEKAQAYLQNLTTNDVSLLKDGHAQYSLFLNERATVIDDIIVYRFDARHYMLCVNASNIQKDFDWMKQHVTPQVLLDNRSDQMGMLALQGPASQRVLSRLGFDLSQLPRFQFIETTLEKVPVMLSRTGYTGEDGCELFVSNDQVLQFWQALLDAGKEDGIKPIGLGARDTLRLEMAYPLYGHELNEEIYPLEAGLSWVVKLQKGEFIGRNPLLQIKENGIARRLVGLVMEEPGIPREGLAVTNGSKTVGKVLSGTFSPSLKVGIATALIEKANSGSPGEIFIDIRGKMKKAKIVKPPFISK